MINKKLIAANFISRYVRRGNIISLTGIHGTEAEIMEFVVPENSKITKKRNKETKLSEIGYYRRFDSGWSSAIRDW